MKTLIAAVTLGMILQGGTAAATIYLYVSPTGNDSGSCSTSNNPCRTIGAAVTKASASEDTIIRENKRGQSEIKSSASSLPATAD